MNRIALKIDGMTCGHCVAAVRAALTSVEGVGDVQVAMGRATVEFDSAPVAIGTLIDAVSDAGYGAVEDAE